jgi:hypothetical protein
MVGMNFVAGRIWLQSCLGTGWESGKLPDLDDWCPLDSYSYDYFLLTPDQAREVARYGTQDTKATSNATNIAIFLNALVLCSCMVAPTRCIHSVVGLPWGHASSAGTGLSRNSRNGAHPSAACHSSNLSRGRARLRIIATCSWYLQMPLEAKEPAKKPGIYVLTTYRRTQKRRTGDRSAKVAQHRRTFFRKLCIPEPALTPLSILKIPVERSYRCIKDIYEVYNRVWSRGQRLDKVGTIHLSLNIASPSSHGDLDDLAVRVQYTTTTGKQARFL